MNKSVIIAIAITIAVLSYTQLNNSAVINPAVPQEIATLFQQWQAHHGKSYTTPEEMIHRLKVFYDNHLYITQKNGENSGVILRLNQFADLHADEFYPSIMAESVIEKQRNAKKKEKMSEKANLKQTPIIDSVNWESVSPAVLPPVGRQDTRCWGASFAWAAQYAVTANHSIKNKVSPQVISAQKLLDCFSHRRPYTCGTEVYNSHFQNVFEQVEVTMQSEYKGPITGYPGECKINSTSELKQSINKPYIISFQRDAYNDKELEDFVKKGVTTSKIFINTKLVQFYSSGVVTDSMCHDGHPMDRKFFTVAITGYNRKGTEQSQGLTQQVLNKPYWQVRWAYGAQYGINGSMRIEKQNDGGISLGPCQIYQESWLPIAKKY